MSCKRIVLGTWLGVRSQVDADVDTSGTSAKRAKSYIQSASK